MNPWTLQFTNAVGSPQTVTFAQLAALEGGKVIADAWQVQFVSHKASTVTLRLPGVPPSQAPAIPFESPISIIGPTGTVFQGYRVDRTGTADPHRTSSSYIFQDAWYFLDHCPFYQQWNRVTSSGATSIVPFQWVVLYQPNPGQIYTPAPVNGVITTGQQIVDILNWAIRQGCNLQIGEIDPAIYQAWYPLQNVQCGDAIRHCLRLHPDCFTEIDYSTTPPAFHVRQRSHLVPVTLPYSYTDPSGRRHTATDIQPRPELQPKRIALFYRVISGSYLLATPVDIYPYQNLSVQGPVITGQSVGGSAAPYTVGGTPVMGTAMTNINGTGASVIPLGAPGGLRALDYGIDLQGPKMTVCTASIATAPFNPANLAWWQNKIPSLNQNISGLTLLSTAVNTGGAQAISVAADGAGALLNLGAFAYELLPQSAPMAWMTASGGGALQVQEAIVTAHFSYTKTKAVGGSNLNIAVPNDHVHHVRVKLCNSASITQSYTQYITTGEATPPDLAQTVYNALATLQYNLTHTIVERPFNGWLKPGKHAINLDAGPVSAPGAATPVAAAWASMLATPQSVDYKMHLDGAGNTFDNFTVKCGPVEHLEPGELVQIFNVFANRDLTKIDTNERLSGTPSPGNTVTMPSDTAQENSVPGIPDSGLQAFSAPDAITGNTVNVITHAPATGQTTVAQLDSTAGTPITSKLVMAVYANSGPPGSSTLS